MLRYTYIGCLVYDVVMYTCMNQSTVSYLADFRGHEVAKPVKPLHIGLKVSRLLHVLERRLKVRVLLGERLNKFLRPYVGQTLQFDVGQLLCQEGGAWTQLSDVSLKQRQRASFWARCYERNHFQLPSL